MNQLILGNNISKLNFSLTENRILELQNSVMKSSFIKSTTSKTFTEILLSS